MEICLKSYLGKWLGLYFYPKDNTGGCTREAVDFSATFPVMRDLGVEGWASVTIRQPATGSLPRSIDWE